MRERTAPSDPEIVSQTYTHLGAESSAPAINFLLRAVLAVAVPLLNDTLELFAVAVDF